MKFMISIAFFSLLFADVLVADDKSDNQQAYQSYNEIYETAPRSKQTLSMAEMNAVMQSVMVHPIANLQNFETVRKYDPTGAIGFCFGRAMATHMHSRVLHLHPDSVKKIFVIGDMRSTAKPEWRFHVTTIVRGPGNKWYAIDPITPGGRVVEAEAWLNWVRKTWDSHNFSKFKTNAYITSGDVVIPNLKTVPGATEINNVDVMSTSFKPETHEGIKKVSGVERFYDISVPEAAEFQRKQFISATEKGGERFDMAKITINESATYEYNRYFLDLLRKTGELFRTTKSSGRNNPAKVMAEYSSRWRSQIWQTSLFAESFEATRSPQTRSISQRRIRETGGFRMDIVERDIDIYECLQ